MLVKDKLSESDYFLYDKYCSYMDEKKREEVVESCKGEGITPHFFMVGCDEAVILETQDSLVIAVSGSDKDKEEWRGNFNAYRGIVDALKKTPKIKRGFHYNFYLQARHLKRIVKSFLKSRPHIKEVIFDGHSRGGAIVRTCYMLMNCEIQLFDMMVTPFDPPKSFTWKGWRWYKRNRKRRDISHRTKSFFSIVGAVPPSILGWIHRDTTLLKLPNVKGKFNHTAITEGLKRKFGVK
jgi:hypothetical protein